MIPGEFSGGGAGGTILIEAAETDFGGGAFFISGGVGNDPGGTGFGAGNGGIGRMRVASKSGLVETDPPTDVGNDAGAGRCFGLVGRVTSAGLGTASPTAYNAPPPQHRTPQNPQAGPTILEGLPQEPVVSARGTSIAAVGRGSRVLAFVAGQLQAVAVSGGPVDALAINDDPQKGPLSGIVAVAHGTVIDLVRLDGGTVDTITAADRDPGTAIGITRSVDTTRMIVSWIALAGSEIRSAGVQNGAVVGTPPALVADADVSFVSLSARAINDFEGRLLVGQGVVGDGVSDARRGVFLFGGFDGEWTLVDGQNQTGFRSNPTAVDLRVSVNAVVGALAGAPADDACLPDAGGVVVLGNTIGFRDVVNSGAIVEGARFGHSVSIGGDSDGLIAVTAEQGPATVFRLQNAEAVAVAIIDGDIAAAIVIDDTTVLTVDRATPSNVGVVTIP